MHSPYHAPVAPLSEDPARFRWVHALLGAASAAAALFGLMYWLFVDESGESFLDWTRLSIFLLAFALVVGACLLPFQRMRWYWAVLVAPIAAISTLLAFGYFVDVTGLF